MNYNKDHLYWTQPHEIWVGPPSRGNFWCGQVCSNSTCAFSDCCGPLVPSTVVQKSELSNHWPPRGTPSHETDVAPSAQRSQTLRTPTIRPRTLSRATSKRVKRAIRLLCCFFRYFLPRELYIGDTQLVFISYKPLAGMVLGNAWLPQAPIEPHKTCSLEQPASGVLNPFAWGFQWQTGKPLPPGLFQQQYRCFFVYGQTRPRVADCTWRGPFWFQEKCLEIVLRRQSRYYVHTTTELGRRGKSLDLASWFQ